MSSFELYLSGALTTLVVLLILRPKKAKDLPPGPGESLRSSHKENDAEMIDDQRQAVGLSAIETKFLHKSRGGGSRN
jgi:hypothetical protein